jgi:hypothetical protein
MDFLPAQVDNSMSHHEALNPTTSINVIIQSPPTFHNRMRSSVLGWLKGQVLSKLITDLDRLCTIIIRVNLVTPDLLILALIAGELHISLIGYQVLFHSTDFFYEYSWHSLHNIEAWINSIGIMIYLITIHEIHHRVQAIMVYECPTCCIVSTLTLTKQHHKVELGKSGSLLCIEFA